jgi:hypothetical protein
MESSGLGASCQQCGSLAHRLRVSWINKCLQLDDQHRCRPATTKLRNTSIPASVSPPLVQISSRWAKLQLETLWLDCQFSYYRFVCYLSRFLQLSNGYAGHCKQYEYVFLSFCPKECTDRSQITHAP